MSKREIKFREWNGFKMDYNAPVSVISTANTNDVFEGREYMQYTGMNDNFGTPIYEGDLLEIPVNPFIKEGIHEVYYYEDSFVTGSIRFSNQGTANKNSLKWIIERGAKVVGNIYENENLLS